MYAGCHNVNNLTAIVDSNGLQIMGSVKDVVCVEPLVDKWAAFGWNVIECNGNSIPEVVAALEQAAATTDKPTVLVARTVKGKGVSFMENSIPWHSKPISKDEFETAMRELGD